MLLLVLHGNAEGLLLVLGSVGEEVVLDVVDGSDAVLFMPKLAILLAITDDAMMLLLMAWTLFTRM